MRLTPLLLPLCLSAAAFAAPLSPEQQASSLRQSLTAWIKADTSNPPGNEAKVVDLIAARLRQAGIPYEIVAFAPGRTDLVARLKGKGKAKPLMLLAHLDVVGTKDQAWTSPPHQLTEKDGFLVGRGVTDDLGMAALNLEVFLALKASGKALQRDVILAYSGDEESGGAGIRYLLEHRPELIDAEIALNEGATTVLGPTGAVRYVGLQTAEKTYADFTVEATGPTGHSSIPPRETAIFTLAQALSRIAAAPMPAHLIPATRDYFTALAALEPGPLQAARREVAASPEGGPLPAAALAKLEENPVASAFLRTTCVATLIAGGTKENALPPSAKATINCRILPDETVALVQQRLVAAAANPNVSIKVVHDYGVPQTSPLDGEVPTAVKAVTSQLYPGTVVMPILSRGATDSRFLRLKGIHAYGIDPLALTEDEAKRAHGIDERLPIASIKPALAFMTELVDRLVLEQR